MWSCWFKRKISDVVDIDVFRKSIYDKIKKKVNAIDTGGFVKKQIIIGRSKILKIKYLILQT